MSTSSAYVNWATGYSPITRSERSFTGLEYYDPTLGGWFLVAGVVATTLLILGRDSGALYSAASGGFVLVIFGQDVGKYDALSLTPGFWFSVAATAATIGLAYLYSDPLLRRIWLESN